MPTVAALRCVFCRGPPKPHSRNVGDGEATSSAVDANFLDGVGARGVIDCGGAQRYICRVESSIAGGGGRSR